MPLPTITFTPTPAVSEVERPHVAFPFEYQSDGTLAVVEEDSVEEVAACVANIAICPQGYRLDMPDFGVSDPSFATLALDPDSLKRAIARWEPRAQLSVEVAPNTDQPWDQQVTVNVEIDD